MEAGCGLEQYVLALRVQGYNAEGVEWAAETVKAVRVLHPDLPIRVGDVTQLEVLDGYYMPLLKRSSALSCTQPVSRLLTGCSTTATTLAMRQIGDGSQQEALETAARDKEVDAYFLGN